MPPHFSSTYTPIAAAGTKGQIRHVARLMATQFTAVNVGPGIRLAKKTKSLLEDEDDEMLFKGSTTVTGEGKNKNKNYIYYLFCKGAKSIH